MINRENQISPRFANESQMDSRDFLLHRIGLLSLPFSLVWEAMEAIRAGKTWRSVFEAVADRLESIALGVEHRRLSSSAVATAWLHAAKAFHVASLALQEEPNDDTAVDIAMDLRRKSAACHARARRNWPETGAVVRIETQGQLIRGLLRTGSRVPMGVVVLLNGLDSLCEVEMHAFGDWFVERGLTVLALDVPANYSSAGQRLLWQTEQAAPAVADWLSDCCGSETRLGAFGVSLGGHLVARLMSGDNRFTAGVAVSPPAWLDESLFMQSRFRRMAKIALNTLDDEEIVRLTRQIRLDNLPRPCGRLLLVHMTRDGVFGPEHTAAYRRWMGSGLEMETFYGEHVGTSCAHQWGPIAVDWIASRLAKKEKHDVVMA